ncbi:MAG TPA: ABC transporter permease [Candidatus Enterenecus stercoripullorum]|nr:ABC transporter permease [Candidatus Enterenecus stercoripullorum]
MCKRLGLLVVTLLLVTILAFLAFSILPGDPTTSILGVDATAEQIAALRARLGLDLPLWQRYLNWVGGLVTGDLGQSYNYAMPVAQLLGSRIAVTATLAGMSFLLIVAIALPLGILCARYEGGVVDKALTVLGQVTMSIPNFLLGFALTYVFSLMLRWFTVGSFTSAAQQGVGAYLGYLFFPALAIALPRAAMTVKMLRGSILSEMGQDYIRTAYSKGNSKSGVLWHFVLRNAMIPVITFLAMTIADIVAGSIVVEQVFAVGGVGQMLVTSIGNRDYPVVQAIVALIAVVVVVCNFLADALYRVMDPRLRQR